MKERKCMHSNVKLADFEMWRDDGALAEAPDSKMSICRPSHNASRAAVIVCPGGGYVMHADHEAEPVAQWLAAHGINAFVLNYRLAPHRHPAMLQDAARAVRSVRHQAHILGLDPRRVGVLGFSAGGHLAATVSTLFDHGDPSACDPVERESSRPDLAVLIYPVTIMEPPFGHSGSAASLLGDPVDPALAKHLTLPDRVSSSTPPMFIVHSADDEGVPVENSLRMAAALSANRVPCEMHVFAHGGHGYGLAAGDPVLASWPKLCIAWLHRNGFANLAE
jgi:acetyl esterase/lipase